MNEWTITLTGLLITGIIFIILLIIGLIWFETKSKKLSKILGKIKDFFESLL